MKKFTVKYYINDEEMCNGNKPHSKIYETEETEADSEIEAIENIMYYLVEQVGQYSNHNAVKENKAVRVYDSDDNLIEEYYNFEVIK